VNRTCVQISICAGAQPEALTAKQHATKAQIERQQSTAALQGSVYVWTMAPPEPEADAPLCIDQWFGVCAAELQAPLGECFSRWNLLV